MSAMVPVRGCNISQPQITAPEAGSTAVATSPTLAPDEVALWASQPPAAASVLNNNNCTATRVVRAAGRIPLNWAMRKNSNSPRCTITPTAKVKNQPPNTTTRTPIPPAAQPLARRAREVRVRGWGSGGKTGSGWTNARRQSEKGARRRPTWPGCRAVACDARWLAPPVHQGLPADSGYRWHQPGPPG